MTRFAKSLAGAVLMLGLGLAAGAPAEAAIAVQPLSTDSATIQVAYGCGPFGHRGPGGACVRNRPRLGYRAPLIRRGGFCPPGRHLGPFGRGCVRNRFYR